MPNRNQFGAPKLVYRIDSRSPEEVFAHGFTPWGSNPDFFGHILGDTLGREASPNRRSGLISATDSPDSALRFFGERLHVPTPAFYLYEIRATNNFYSAQRTASFYEQRIATGQIEVTHGSFDDACSAIELLRTAFAYQREWFSVGPIPANQVRSAWRVDTVAINPLHIQHQRQVHYTPRINDPEIHNDHYQDAETYANHLPYTQGATLTTPSRISMPENVLDSDVDGGVEASLGFACFIPESPKRSPRSSDEKAQANNELVCYYERGYQLKRNLRTKKTDHILSSTLYSHVHLETKDTKQSFILSYQDAVHHPTFPVTIKKVDDPYLPSINFIYDTFQCLNWNPSSREYSLALAPLAIGQADLYALTYSVATTNDSSQKWYFHLVSTDGKVSYYRIENKFLKSFSLYKSKSSNQLFLRPINSKSNSYEEIYLAVGEGKSDDILLLQQNPATKLMDIQLAWNYNGQNWIPYPETNQSTAANPKQNVFFYDLNTNKILYINPQGQIFGLYNKRDYRYYSWDWINWTPTNLQKTTNNRFRWYFNNEDWQVSDEFNYRNIMSFENNDYLRVVLSGINNGKFYTTYSPTDYNSIALFRIFPKADV